MPTGYTAAIEDGISFEKFVWSCARAFGALIEMRDDPADAPIPEKFETSNYHQKRLAEAQERLTRLNNYTGAEVEKEAARSYEDALNGHRTYQAKKDALRTKYYAMLEKVEAWTPPTKDHEGLKTFMADQIRDSIKFDCGVSYDRDPQRLTGEQWRKEQTENALRDIRYHTEEHAKEQTRTAERNQWIASLRVSLGQHR